QVNNYGNGGLGGDPVRAEAQDGSRFDNASFFSPPDSLSGRLSMHLWSPGALLDVLAPAPIAGGYALGRATFGAQTYDLTEDVVSVIDADGTDFGCTPPFQNADALAGKIALVQRR